MRYLAFILLVLFVKIPAQEEFSSSHSWMFTDGNLIANWSFEEYSSELCSEGAANDGSDPGRFEYNCRRKSADQHDEPVPYSGNYVLKVTTSNSVGFKTGPFSEPIEIVGGANYKLNLRILGMLGGQSGAVNYPIVNFYDEFGVVVDQVSGSYYESSLPVEFKWEEYGWTFAAPAGATQARLFLVNMQASQNNEAKNLYFDDIKLTRADQEEFAPNEIRSYGDAFSRVRQSISYDGAESVVRESEYDPQGKIKKEYLPISVLDESQKFNDYIVSSVLLDGALKADYTNVQSAYLGVKAILQSLQLGSTPVVVQVFVVVANEGDLAPVLEQALEIEPIPISQGASIELEIRGVVKGTAEYSNLVASAKPFIVSHFSSYYQSEGTFEDDVKRMYPGEDNVKLEYNYPDDGANTVASSALPGDGYGFSDSPAYYSSTGSALLETGDIPANPEYNPATETGDPVSGEFDYSWKRDRMGNYTVEILNENGTLKTSAFNKVASPTSAPHWAKKEYSYNSFNQLFSTSSPEGLVTQYAFDGSNRMVAYNDPDRGGRDYLYDKDGNLRFAKSPRIESEGNVLFFKYDHTNRLIGTGLVAKANFTQGNADNPLYPPDDKISKGSIFDEIQIGEWEQNLSLQFSNLGIDVNDLKYGRGKIVMAFNRNMESSVPGMGTVVEKFNADFFSYDEKGRLSEKYVYVGMAPAGRKLHKIKYAYDDLDRVLMKTVYKDQTESVVAVQNSYVYNNKGQLVSILDKNGVVMMASEYNFRDELIQSDIFNEVEVSYGHDIQGKLISLSANRVSDANSHLYSESLGYENKPDSRMADDFPPSLARYDGKKSSILRQFSNQATKSVEWDQYNYNVTGYLNTQNKKLPSSPATTLPDGSIDITSLNFSGGETEAQGYTYDTDFRMTTQAKNSITYNYEYTGGTHQVTQVSPSISSERNTSQANAFVYDQNGSMKTDNSSGKDVVYNSDELPIKMTQGGKTWHFLYSPEGYRTVTAVENQNGNLEKRKVYVYESGLDVLKEIEISASGTVVRNKFEGIDGEIGFEIESSGIKVLAVKNHLGSTVANLRTASTGLDFEKGYNPYGVIEHRVNSQNPDLESSEGWTGKEFDEDLALTYFGARFYDPMLGIWMSTDRASQFSNPYAYHGDPISYVDPDGEYFWILLGAAIGAGVGAYQGYQAGATGWAMAGYVSGGAAIGALASVGAGFLAPAATAAATSVGGALGLSGGAAGFYGAVAGGAITGATVGAASYSGHYALGTALGDPNLGNYWSGLGKSAAFGAVLGGTVSGALSGFHWASGALQSGVTSGVIQGTRNPSGLAPRLTVQGKANSASGGAPRVNKLGPESEMPHSVFKTNPAGKVTGYTTFGEKGIPVSRFRGEGGPHGGKSPPFVLEPKPGKGPGAPLKVPRVPNANELPLGY